MDVKKYVKIFLNRSIASAGAPCQIYKKRPPNTLNYWLFAPQNICIHNGQNMIWWRHGIDAYRTTVPLSWWRHQMETFSALLAIYGPVKSPHKGPWRRALMFSFICVWINGWVNNRKAGDLSPLWRHRNVKGIHRSHMNSLHGGTMTWSFGVIFWMLVWTKLLVSPVIDGLRCHDAQMSS